MKILISGPIIFSHSKEKNLYSDYLLKAFQNAKKEIKIASYVLKDEWIIDTIKHALRDNIKVRVIVDKAGVENNNKKIALEFEALKNIYNNFDFKVYKGKKDSMHAKFLIFDGELAIVGSHNITQSGLHRNIEIGVLIKEDNAIAELDSIFEGVWEIC